MEQFVQLLISIIALFSSIILIFNGCTSSKPDIIKNEKKPENPNKKSPRNSVEEKKDEEQEQDTIIKAKYVKEEETNESLFESDDERIIEVDSSAQSEAQVQNSKKEEKLKKPEIKFKFTEWDKNIQIY